MCVNRLTGEVRTKSLGRTTYMAVHLWREGRSDSCVWRRE